MSLQADKECAEDKLRYDVNTAATSGTISTQYFGHKFEKDKIERDLKYVVRIHPPKKYKKNKNITLYIDIENNLLQKYEKFYSSFSSTDTDTKLSRAISPPVYKWYALQRKMSEDGASDLQVDLMPGFRLTWHYNKNSDSDYLATELRNNFRR